MSDGGSSLSESETGDIAAQVGALESENAQLRDALESRIAIEQAKGVLAERFEISAEEAFALLRFSARSSHLPIQAVAPEVRPGEPIPDPVVQAIAKSSRWRALVLAHPTDAARARAAQLLDEVDQALKRRYAIKPTD